MSIPSSPTSYEVTTDGFSGPLHLLLSLIESKEMPVTDVALREVTQQYLTYLDEHEVPVMELADFLVVATRLLYLKSQELLPVIEREGEEEGHLVDQLRIYQQFVEVAKEIETLFSLQPRMAVRPKAVLPKPEIMSLPAELTKGRLQESFGALLRRLRPFFSLRETTMERVRSVSDRMQELREALVVRARIAFRDLTAGTKNKMDVVVSFLALLELVKQRAVHTTQSSTFSDISIDRV